MGDLRLNIGAGHTFIPGFQNIDVSERADIRVDIGRELLPFESDSVELVFSYHTLEHVDDYLFALGEIHRVLRHGGHFLLGVPYVTLTEFNLINPYHRHHFSERSFDFFDPARLKGTAAEQNPIRFRKAFHRFHYIGGFHLVPPPFRSWCRRHLFNVVRKIDLGLVAIKDGEQGVPVEGDTVRAMRREFRACVEARRPYEGGPDDEGPAGGGRWREGRGGSAAPPLIRVAKWWRGHGL